MGKVKIEIKSADILKYNPELVRHSNAFILQNGDFILAKGYTGCNPYQQLESSSLHIGRQIIGCDIQKEYDDYIKRENLIKRLYTLRAILVQYYGYALFAR